jgi:hypothetical protein
MAPTRLSDISESDARLAGFTSRAGLLRQMKAYSGSVYRIRLRWLGPDPREQLRRVVALSSSELSVVGRKLARMDSSSEDGPWTRRTLDLIHENPGVRASELARMMKLDTGRFKRRVRNLKALGLTESLDVGYRLSPRGRVVVRCDGG